MNAFNLSSVPSWEDWLLSLGILVGTVLIATLARAVLKALQRHHQLSFLAELGPSLSNLIYVFGFKAFLESAPLHPRVEKWMEHGIYILVVIMVLNLIRRGLLLAIEWSYQMRASSSPTLQQGFIPLLRNVITLFVLATGGIMVLKHFDYDVMSLLTALGVGSLAVGLAAKDTLSNMISGFTLIIDRNMTPGDRINLAGSIGEVEEIGLRSTRIKIGDGNTLIVPNAELVNTKILNLSIPSRETTGSVKLRFAYTVPFEKIRSICLETVKDVAKIKQTKNASVLLTSVSEGFQLVTVSYWLDSLDNSGEAASDFQEKLLARLQREQISLVPSAQFFPPPSSS